MKEIYSNKIFNWLLVILLFLDLLNRSYLLFIEPKYLNLSTLSIVLLGISTLSFLSFFIRTLNGELFTRLFILASFVFFPLAVYLQFFIDKVLYSFTRLELISNPATYINFCIGLMLFYFSIKYSVKLKDQRQSEYGIIMMIYGFLLIIIYCTRMFNDEASITKLIIKLVLSVGIIFIGKKLKDCKLKLKTSIITFLILTVISISI